MYMGDSLLLYFLRSAKLASEADRYRNGMNLRTYIDQKRGQASLLGRLMNVSPVLISQWANGHRPIPAERCPEIERATGGAVICEDLRPDVDWQVIRANPRPIPRSL